MDSDIEDIAIDTDEVNQCFREGVNLEGTMFLERVEKQAMEQGDLESEERLIKIFDHLTRKVDKGASDKISLLHEFERFGLSSEVILKLGNLFVDVHHNSSRVSRSPDGQPSNIRNKGSDRYDDDFDDYESDDFEDYEQVPNSPKFSQTARSVPKYIDEEPLPRASKSAPAGQSVSGSMRMDSNSPKYAVHSSKFKGTSLSWIKKGHWRKGEKIGSGSFGEVYQGMTDGGMLFAVKCMSFSHNIKEMNNLIAEIELMQSLCHPNIVQYLGASVSNNRNLSVS